MPGIGVFIATPTAGGVAGRRLHVSGSVAAFRGRLATVSIQLGAGGPTFAATAGSFSWSWTGFVPNEIRPGQAFAVTVTATGFMNIASPTDPEPDIVEVDGTRTVNVVLENIVPVLNVAPFQSPVVAKQVPYALTLTGSATHGTGIGGVAYSVERLQYQIGTGPLIDIPQGSSGNWAQWSLPLTLAPGNHAITIQASDAYASVTTYRRTLRVYSFALAEPADPNAKLTLSGIPTTSSITSWTRLEPRCVEAEIGLTSNARLFDPLWLMTRQWQLGEFQGEDAGSPVQARVRATSATLTRCRFGELQANAAAPQYDPLKMPLETLVERRRMRPSDATDLRMLPLAIEAGLHFLRMLDLNATAKKYRAAFLARYAMQPLTEPAATTADDATRRLMQCMALRAPDARLLATAFRISPIVFDAALKIAAADSSAVQQVALAWLAWYDSLCAEPATLDDDAWSAPRLEYAMSVSTRMSGLAQDALTLSANEYTGGTLDWSSFDVNAQHSLDTTGDKSFGTLNEITIPAPVAFHGAPATRFWEMEDGALAYGLLPVGPTDLAPLLLIEYASSYGNDWYVVPLTIPVGSVTRVDSLIVTDTFGVRSLVRPIGDVGLPPAHFSMWQQSPLRRAGEAPSTPVRNRFFLPPTIARAAASTPLEDVLFMRDEMANMAWAIERSIESPSERALPRDDEAVALPSTGSAPTTLPRYLLASEVAPNWIPLLPVQLQGANSKLISRLKKGAMLQADGSRKVHHAKGELLSGTPNLLLYDEEVPREGIRITRQRKMSRWTDGSTWLWTTLRAQVGRGEGSSGLKYDQLRDSQQG